MARTPPWPTVLCTLQCVFIGVLVVVPGLQAFVSVTVADFTCTSWDQHQLVGYVIVEMGVEVRIERKTDRQTDRRADGQTDRQTDRPTHR